MMNEEELFWHNVCIGKEEVCWRWMGKKRDGYGVWKNKNAHRFAYSFFYKIEIPKGHATHICHKCDNRACCNPRHLYLGTPKTNTQDKMNRRQQFELELKEDFRRMKDREDRIRTADWIAHRNAWKHK